jgi:putative ABC transport system permease protein
VLVFPLLLCPLLRLVEALPLSLEGRLAARLLQRRRARTALTAGVLFLSLAVTVGFGHSLRAILAEVRNWCRRTIRADFLVRGPMPDSGFVLVPALPDALADQLANLEGVAGVDRIAFLPAEGNGQAVLVLARTFAADQPLPLDLRAGEPGLVREGLLRGEVVLGSVLAGRLRLAPGDRFTLTTPRGPASLRIAGIASELAGGGAALYLEWRKANELLDVTGPHVFLVRAHAGAAPLLGQRLRTFCASRELLLQSRAEMHELVDGHLKRLGGAIGSLIVLIFVVSSLGKAATLQISSREQAGDFGILHALGLRRRQVAWLVLWQGLVLAGLALLPGALAGLGIAFVLTRGSGAGMNVPFRPEVGLLAASAALALGGAVLAALGPARRAAKLCHSGAP